MIEVACTCDGLPAHSHVWRWEPPGQFLTSVQDEYDVRIWIDWKAVAQELMSDT